MERKYVSPWTSNPPPQPSPDGSLVAEVADTCEFQMSGPVFGTLRISNGLTEDNCGVSIAWSFDSRYLAVPKLFPERPPHIKILLIDTVTGTRRFAPGEYGPISLVDYAGPTLTVVLAGEADRSETRTLDLSRVVWPNA